MNAPRSTHLRAYQCLTVKLRTKPDVAASMDVATVITFHAFHAHASGCARFTFSVICWLEQIWADREAFHFAEWLGMGVRRAVCHSCLAVTTTEPTTPIWLCRQRLTRLCECSTSSAGGCWVVRRLLGGDQRCIFCSRPRVQCDIRNACADNIRIRYFLDCYRKGSDIATIA